MRLLTLAARAYDEAEAASALVRREGLTTTMPSGARRAHPAVRIATECRAAFRHALRELDLDVDPPAEEKRPPLLRSIVGGKRA